MKTVLTLCIYTVYS